MMTWYRKLINEDIPMQLSEAINKEKESTNSVSLYQKNSGQSDVLITAIIGEQSVLEPLELRPEITNLPYQKQASMAKRIPDDNQNYALLILHRTEAPKKKDKFRVWPFRS